MSAGSIDILNNFYIEGWAIDPVSQSGAKVLAGTACVSVCQRNCFCRPPKGVSEPDLMEVGHQLARAAHADGILFQPCDRGRLRGAMYFATEVWPISMPSLRSSP